MQTFNICEVCGKPIEKNDYCWAEGPGDAKTGIRNGRLVFLQHHLKCAELAIKTKHLFYKKYFSFIICFCYFFLFDLYIV